MQIAGKNICFKKFFCQPLDLKGPKCYVIEIWHKMTKILFVFLEIKNEVWERKILKKILT